MHEELTLVEFIEDCEKWCNRFSDKFYWTDRDRIERLIKELKTTFDQKEMIESELKWSKAQNEGIFIEGSKNEFKS